MTYRVAVYEVFRLCRISRRHPGGGLDLQVSPAILKIFHKLWHLLPGCIPSAVPSVHYMATDVPVVDFYEERDAKNIFDFSLQVHYYSKD